MGGEGLNPQGGRARGEGPLWGGGGHASSPFATPLWCLAPCLNCGLAPCLNLDSPLFHPVSAGAGDLPTAQSRSHLCEDRVKGRRCGWAVARGRLLAPGSTGGAGRGHGLGGSRRAGDSDARRARRRAQPEWRGRLLIRRRQGRVDTYRAPVPTELVQGARPHGLLRLGGAEIRAAKGNRGSADEARGRRVQRARAEGGMKAARTPHARPWRCILYAYICHVETPWGSQKP